MGPSRILADGPKSHPETWKGSLFDSEKAVGGVADSHRQVVCATQALKFGRGKNLKKTC
jgi:hypothetical protein